jgi:hypothetical protein
MPGVAATREAGMSQYWIRPVIVTSIGAMCVRQRRTVGHRGLERHLHSTPVRRFAVIAAATSPCAPMYNVPGASHVGARHDNGPQPAYAAP